MCSGRFPFDDQLWTSRAAWGSHPAPSTLTLLSPPIFPDEAPHHLGLLAPFLCPYRSAPSRAGSSAEISRFSWGHLPCCRFLSAGFSLCLRSSLPRLRRAPEPRLTFSKAPRPPVLVRLAALWAPPPGRSAVSTSPSHTGQPLLSSCCPDGSPAPVLFQNRPVTWAHGAAPPPPCSPAASSPGSFLPGATSWSIERVFPCPPAGAAMDREGAAAGHGGWRTGRCSGCPAVSPQASPAGPEGKTVGRLCRPPLPASQAQQGRADPSGPLPGYP